MFRKTGHTITSLRYVQNGHFLSNKLGNPISLEQGHFEIVFNVLLRFKNVLF